MAPEPLHAVGRPANRLRQVTVAFGIGLASMVVLLVAVFATAPSLRSWLTYERGLIDLLTLGLLVSALGLSGYAVWRRAPLPRPYLLVPLAVLLALGEETGYGSAWMDYRPPVVGGNELDGFTSLVELGTDYIELAGVRTEHLVALVTTGLVGGAVYLTTGWRRRRLLLWVDRWRPLALLAGAGVMAAAAVAVDVTISGRMGEFIDQLLELGAAGTLALAAIATTDPRITTRGWRRRLWRWIADDGPLATMPDDAPGARTVG